MDRDGVGQLLADAGMDTRRFRTALALLCDGGWWTLADLVRETATSRRSIEALLREVAPERSGERFRLTPDQIRSCRDLLADDPDLAVPLGRGPVPGPRSHGPADPVSHLLPHHRQVVEQLANLIAQAPRGRHVLDHVAATPETVVRRALLLGARFWLRGARLLCVGDHDLTSLAVKLIHPEADVTVVDIDERILAYIDEQAERMGCTVRTRWADLRLGLPPSTRDQADLALTDPPYTPEGVGLFVSRAVEGLRDPEKGRVILAYGASERTPMLALKVQNSLHDLNLTYEAIYPDFNRYFGAEAIGSAADLYFLRPTTKTRPAVSARVDHYGTAIYTQGPQSVESHRPSGAADTAAAGPGFEPGVLVGDWPKDVSPKTPRARLSTWLAKPYASAPQHVAIAVPAGLEAAIPRLLLAARARHVRVSLAESPDDLAALSELLSPVYRITARGTVLDAVRLAPPEDRAGRLLRGILDNAHGKLANTWREGLIRANAELTKKQARAIITEVAPWADDVTLLELPVHRLRGVRAAVIASLGSVTGSH
ncbi:bis-aminopropyl spermidine synthase family protein [Rhizohabitans arisaemae]|uniref:bis-aminopropyl spermidine synthase family protein n=1 Tax=Rhizohabitans arisaemae TaxID=2720610 RepID=UPI0024B1D364|nr:bis-aminopropyl spermidine synthase family protein [Rhizohabitans arisaemae]